MVQQLISGLGSAFSMFAQFVPKLIAFLIILAIGFFIAKAISKGLTMLLNKVGFNRLIEKTGLSGSLAQSGFDAGGILVKIVHYFIVLIFLKLALLPFGQSNPVSQLLDQIITFLPRIVVALVLVLIAAAIANAVKDIVRRSLAGKGAAGFLSNIAYYVILAFGIIAALGQIGVATIITGPVLIAVLATVSGVIIVGFGGGLIKATSEKWPGWLDDIGEQFKGGSAPGHQETSALPQHGQHGSQTTGNFGGQLGGDQPPTPPQGGTYQ